jgi:hypothetical protein
MFYRYNHPGNGRMLVAIGGSDMIGQVGPAAQSFYSFAEGYTNVGYDQWRQLQGLRDFHEGADRRNPGRSLRGGASDLL